MEHPDPFQSNPAQNDAFGITEQKRNAESTYVKTPEIDYKPLMMQVNDVLIRSKGWIKFLGIVLIVYGALLALTVWGLLVAWLPIWMGVLLYQASSHAESVLSDRRGINLFQFLEKIRLCFKISALVLIVGLGLGIIGFVIAGSALFALLGSGGFENLIQ